MARAILPSLGLAALLSACPQDIFTVDGGFPAGPDAAMQAPTCAKEGPSFSCVAQNDMLLVVHEIAVFKCALPGGARAVRFKTLRTDHGEVSLGVQQDSATGEVRVQLQKPGPPPFPDTTIRAFVTLAWDDEPDACTVQEVTTRWAGDVWVADPDNQQVVVLDSSGAAAGTVALGGMSQPRAFGRASDGVLVAGQHAGAAALAVYDNAGRKVRDFVGMASLTGKPVRAVAAMGTSVYLTTGTGVADATLWRIVGDGTAEKLSPSATALAPLTDRLVVAGLSNSASWLQLTPDEPTGALVASAAYRDGANAVCNVQGAFAATAFAAGGFLFSLRHADGTGAQVLGLLASFNSGFAVSKLTAHLDTNLPGNLSMAGSFDWLEELRPNLVVGSRDTSANLSAIDVSAIGVKDTVGNWGTLPASTMPKGLLRLR